MNTDPKKRYAQLPYPKQHQSFPGIESEMDPLPDYGKGSYKASGRLSGKVAVITGGDSGIGRAIAYTYAAEGTDVVISYLNEEEDALHIQKDIQALGRKAELIPGDITEESHCKTIIEKTVQLFGKLDILINNAAFQQRSSSITEIPDGEFEKSFKTNVFAIYYLCKYALPHLKPGASIINTTSIQAYQPSPDLLAYASTKGALLTFTRSFAQEAIKKGVRVNAVAPGPVWTPFIPSSTPPEETAQFGKDSLFERPAQPIELAPIFLFLASESASYITGQTYGATGQAMP